MVDPDAESDFRVRLIKYQNFNDLFYLRQHGKKYFSSSFTMYILPTQHSLTRMLETPFQADNRSNADNIDNRAKSNVANDTNNNATSIKHSSSTIGLSGADKQESSSSEELHELNQHLDELMPGTVWRDFVPRLFKTKAVRNKFRNEDLQLAYEQEMYEAHEHHLRKMEKRSW